ncbi:hypothetical protein ABBQ38_011997 [Trebouxia sp. C0009 RCD-2024]
MVTSQQSRAEGQAQHANHAGHRPFTGNANIRPGLRMDSLSTDAGSQHASSTSAPAKQAASMQSAFTMGSGAPPLSPSKKRTHKDLKMKQTPASSPSSQPVKANPFAPYGVSSSSSQASKHPAQRSPAKVPPGVSPTRRIKVTLKGLNGAQSMHIDSGLPPAGTSSLFGAASQTPGPDNDFHPFSQHATAQPSNAPSNAAAATTGTGFTQSAVPTSHVPPPHHNRPPTCQGTFPAQAAAPGAPSHPTAASANPPSPGRGAGPRASTSAPTASPAAAATPPSFRFSASYHTTADASSSQAPFQGFAAAGPAQEAPEPAVSFAGFQPGIQSTHPNFDINSNIH